MFAVMEISLFCIIWTNTYMEWDNVQKSMRVFSAVEIGRGWQVCGMTWENTAQNFSGVSSLCLGMILLRILKGRQAVLITLRLGHNMR